MTTRRESYDLSSGTNWDGGAGTKEGQRSTVARRRGFFRELTSEPPRHGAISSCQHSTPDDAMAESEITSHLQVYLSFVERSGTAVISMALLQSANGKNNQAPALVGGNEMIIFSTSLRMTSAFNFPTCKTSSCDTVGVGGRSNAIPAI